MTRLFRGVSTLILCSGIGAGCRQPDDPTIDREALNVTLQAGDEIVAEVEGRPISASQVRDQMRAAGTDARAALRSLVESELLAQVALARGLAGDPEVREARRSAEVRRLLKDGFERETPPERIPDADFRRLYDRNHAVFDHEEGVEVWHIVALTPEGTTPEARAQAKAAIVALGPRAAAATSDEAFARLAAGEAVPMKAEHFTIPRHGAVEEPFAEAAFRLSGPGATSGLVETRYGYHLIRLVGRVPARHTDLEAARAELHDGALAAWRRRELDRWLRELIEKTHIETFPERLSTAGEAVP